MGAEKVDIVRMVIRQGLFLTGFGIAVGLVASVLLTRLLRSTHLSCRIAHAGLENGLDRHRLSSLPSRKQSFNELLAPATSQSTHIER